jgi:hypothetical protein
MLRHLFLVLLQPKMQQQLQRQQRQQLLRLLGHQSLR